MQLGRLEFQHIAVLHRIALPALVVHGGSLSIVELQCIMMHCGIATYCIALWNCNVLCCIVELQRIMLHYGTLSPAHSSALSTGQVGFFDVAADCIALRLNTHISHSTPAVMATGPMVLDEEVDKEVNVVSDIIKLFNLSTLMF